MNRLGIMIKVFAIALYFQQYAVSEDQPTTSHLSPTTTPNSLDKPHTYELSNSHDNSTAVLLSTPQSTPRSPSQHCSSNDSCSELLAVCLDCSYNHSCVYGQKTTSQCRPAKNVVCSGEQVFNVSHECLYCYQSSLHTEHSCVQLSSCRSNGLMGCVYARSMGGWSSHANFHYDVHLNHTTVITVRPHHHHHHSKPPFKYIANCSVHPHIFCLGRRSFNRMRRCKWTSGKRWRTALLYSITLGGLGADRFYLGHWKEGLGKLFSFGGLGVWTLVDVLLVATGYLTPADGSMYI